MLTSKKSIKVEQTRRIIGKEEGGKRGDDGNNNNISRWEGGGGRMDIIGSKSTLGN